MRFLDGVLRLLPTRGTTCRCAAIVVTCLLVTLSTPAFAELKKGNFEVGLDFGYTDFDSLAANGDGWRIAVRGGYFFTHFFQIEGQLGASLSGDVELTVALGGAFVNGVFNFRTSKAVVPYLLVGIGQTTLEYTSDLDPDFKVDDGGVGYQGGVGTRFFFGEKKILGFRAELSLISEDSFDSGKTYTNLVVGISARIGK